MLPIGNDKDGNFLFIKNDATEKDYREVKKMNINMIDMAFANGDINEDVKNLFYDVWNNEPIIQDNEIRVICSNVDKDKVESFLKLIFNDSLYTPEPEPFYILKFSNPESYSKLKKQTNVVIAAIDRDSSNAGLKLIEKILPQKQRKNMVSNDPIILAKNVHML